MLNSEPRNKAFNLPSKGVYQFQKSESQPPIARKHSDIVWFHQQLRRDFPGLRLNGPPSNDLASVSEFFDSILRIDIVSSCHLTRFFCVCNDDTRIKDFVRQRNALFPEADNIDKFKSFFSDSVAVSRSELELIKTKAAHLPNLERSMTAECSLFAENILESSQVLALYLSRMTRLLAEIETSFSFVSAKFKEVVLETESMISVIKKLNFAKTQFPQFDDSQINVDIILMKLKNAFDTSGFFTS